MRMVSRLTGLGTKPTTPSSFTGRPIHHSLLNFCSGGRKSESVNKGMLVWSGSWWPLLSTLWCVRRSRVRPCVCSKPLWHGGSPWPQRWQPGPAQERCRRLPVCTRSCNVLQMPQACTEEGGDTVTKRKSFLYTVLSIVDFSSTCRELFYWCHVCSIAQHFMCFVRMIWQTICTCNVQKYLFRYFWMWVWSGHIAATVAQKVDLPYVGELRDWLRKPRLTLTSLAIYFLTSRCC